MIRQINTREANCNTWTLKLGTFSKFQNVISDNLTEERHYDPLSTKIDMLLIPKNADHQFET